MKLLCRKMLLWAGASLVFLVSAESTCRVGDWVQASIPFMATPDREHDLVIKHGDIHRGRPHGKFKKWHLNAYGFRGAPISQNPAVDCTRVMILGASESFGLYEANHQEYPARLQTFLNKHGCFEVVNAAMVGMTLHSMLPYWEQWASQFHPHLVVIYPSPMFYLNFATRPARSPAKPPLPILTVLAQDDASAVPPLRSRLMERLRDHLDVPDFLQRYRDQWAIAARTKGQSEAWFFHELPETQLQWFIEDLKNLAHAIAATGAQPVLLTHAIRSKSQPDAQDLQELEGARVNTPRALPQAIVAFERAAVEQTLALGQRYGWPVVDVAAVMNGQREYFADLVHFNDTGASVIAQLLAHQILSLPRERLQVAPIPPNPGMLIKNTKAQRSE